MADPIHKCVDDSEGNDEILLTDTEDKEDPAAKMKNRKLKKPI